MLVAMSTNWTGTATIFAVADPMPFSVPEEEHYSLRVSHQSLPSFLQRAWVRDQLESRTLPHGLIVAPSAPQPTLGKI